jgi:ParB family chromosome partitioning protein
MDAVKPGETKGPVRKLGRGLSGLMNLAAPVSVEPVAQPIVTQELADGVAKSVYSLSDFQRISVFQITTSPFQPRKVMDDAAIQRLSESIKRSGMMQPIIVRQRSGGGGYELVAGERRWRAAKRAGLTHVPALVRPLDDEQAAEWGLVENVQREDLNPMERAWALRGLSEKFRVPHADLADRVGLDRSTVANLIRLTELEPEIAGMISQGQLSGGHGKALLMAPPGAARVALAKDAAAGGWSVRRLEAAVKQGDQPPRPAPALHDSAALRLAGLRDLERQIGQQLGTKVIITTDRQGKRGRLEIEFYGLDHFDGLLARLNIRTQ